jgi:hypothetical protein
VKSIESQVDIAIDFKNGIVKITIFADRWCLIHYKKNIKINLYKD